MPILLGEPEQFSEYSDYTLWLALVLDKQRQMVKARAIAEKAAFADLPANEQRTYVMLALEALKKESVS